MGTVETWPVGYPVLQLNLHANVVYSCINCFKVFISRNSRHKDVCKKRSLGRSTELIEAEAADEGANADLAAAVTIGSLILRKQLFATQRKYAIAGDRSRQRPTLASKVGTDITAALQLHDGEGNDTRCRAH